MDMLSHPIEEVIPEVLLGLQVHHPPKALEVNLVTHPLQPHGKGGNLFITPLAHPIKFCLRTSNEATMPKMTGSLHSVWLMLVVGLTTVPFNDQIILSQTTTSG